jgi:transcriptional regulator with XRE-family HTH domain
MSKIKKDWSFNESLEEWITKQLNRDKPNWTIAKLTRTENIDPEKPNKEVPVEAKIGPATLYNMKKDKGFFISSTKLRDAIAYNNDTGRPYLGYYGYPPIKSGDKDLPFAIEKHELIDWMLSDLEEIFREAKSFKSCCGFCEPVLDIFTKVDYWTENEEKLWQKGERKVDTFYTVNGIKDVKSVFITSHNLKLYGAIRAHRCKHFVVKMDICNDCFYFGEIQKILVTPISSLINLIKEKHHLTQSQIATELSNTQSTVSKLESDEVEFIDPLIIQKLYGLFLLGTLTKDKKYYSPSSLGEFIKEIKMKGYESYNFDTGTSLTIPSSTYLRPNINLADNSLRVSCDLFITSSDSAIRIACFYDPQIGLREVQIFIACALNLGATHVCLLSENSYKSARYLCINIQHGHHTLCTLPFNKSILLVRDINEKAKYRELDAALIIHSTRRYDGYDGIEQLSSLKRRDIQFCISQEKFKQRPEGFDHDAKDYYQDEIDYRDNIEKYFTRDSNVFGFDYINDLAMNDFDENIESIQKFFYWDENSLEVIPDFQVNICVAIEMKHRAVKEICDIYNITPDVIYAWQSAWCDRIYDAIDNLTIID